MAELYIWAAAGSFALLGFGLAKRLGLLDAVPRDPVARVAAYSSGALSVVKDQLIGSVLESWTSERVDYRKFDKPCALWVENGALICEHNGARESFPLGDLGYMTFLCEGNEMSVKIFVAETGGSERTADVSVRMLSKSA